MQQAVREQETVPAGAVQRYFIFGVDTQMYALALEAVEKVIRAVELTRMPNAPELVSGLINMRGRVVPVVNIRKVFRLPEREMELEDFMIIAKTSTWRIAFLVDWVHGVREFGEDEVDRSGEMFPDMDDYIEGVGHLDGETVLIYESNKLLSAGDMKRLRSQIGGRS